MRGPVSRLPHSLTAPPALRAKIGRHTGPGPFAFPLPARIVSSSRREVCGARRLRRVSVEGHVERGGVPSNQERLFARCRKQELPAPPRYRVEGQGGPARNFCICCLQALWIPAAARLLAMECGEPPGPPPLTWDVAGLHDARPARRSRGATTGRGKSPPRERLGASE